MGGREISPETMRVVMLQIGGAMPREELALVALSLMDMAKAPDHFPLMLLGDYPFIRWVPRVGWCGVHPLLYHWTVHYGIRHSGIDGRYCFKTEAEAREALIEWQGDGDIPGRWHKHPPSGRRRDPDTGEIWNEEDDGKRRAARMESAE